MPASRCDLVRFARCAHRPSNGRAFSGEPSERSERSERKRGRRVRCNAMLDANRTREVRHRCTLSNWNLDHAPRRAASATEELRFSGSFTVTVG